MSDVEVEITQEELAEKLEELELGFEELLVQMSVMEMSEVAQGLELDENLWDGKSKLQIRKVLRQDMDKEDDKLKLKSLVTASKLMMGLKKAKNLVVVEEKPETKMVEKIEKDLLTQMSELLSSSSSPQSGSSSSSEAKAAVSTLLGVSSALRKDFKITGHISSDTSVKDRITYVNVLKQIEEAKLKKYTEGEIIIGIQKAIPSQDSSLRSYFEITPDLNLAKVVEMIRMTYHEKTPTELYQELVQLKQKEKEEASEFLVRAMEIRGKIVFVAKDANEIQYTSNMVQSLFLRTIESGMAEEVVNKIRPVLVTPGVSDVQLMQAVTDAESMLKLRESKNGSGGMDKKVVKSVEVVDYNKQLMEKVLMLMEEFEKIRKRLDKYDEGRQPPPPPQQQQQPQSQQQQHQQQPPRQNRRVFGRCTACVESNTSFCRHCFKCGGEDHKARECTLN